jgi:hypothetical protein
MLHIIDANNLAGKLGLLGHDDFDTRLVSLVKRYSRSKKFVLVFDSADPMGDKRVENNLTIVYTPKDDYYKNADDKIIEIALAAKNEKIRVITDDIEIKEKISRINLDQNSDMELEQASCFAKKLERFSKDFSGQNRSGKNNNKEELSDDEVDNINNELLNIWK